MTVEREDRSVQRVKPSPWRLSAPAALVVIGCTVFLFVAQSTLVYRYLGSGFGLGTIFGHAALAAAWVAMGPGRFLVRLPLAFAWMAGLSLAAAFSLPHVPLDIVVMYAIIVIGAWLLLQLPFWGIAYFLGVRLRRDVVEGGRVRAFQFSVRKVMGFTGLVCLVLAIARISVPLLFPRYREAFVAVPLVTLHFGARLVVNVPLVLATLRERQALLTVFGVLAVSVVATFVEGLLQPVVSVVPDVDPDFWRLVSMNAVSSTWILLIAGLMRWAGYRLRAVGGS